MTKCVPAAAVLAAVSLSVSCAATGIVEDSRLVARDFGGANLCPDDRVVVSPAPHLRMAPPVGRWLNSADTESFAPWQEPTAPAEVANDPGRMRMWREKRDADHATWLRNARAVDRQSELINAQYRAMQVLSVSGCGSSQLYACRDVSARRGRSLYRSCSPAAHIGYEIDIAPARVLCANGGVMRSDGASISCSNETAKDDFEATASACDRRCREEIHAGRCQLACAIAARQECESRGLATLGLCDRYQKAEQGLDAESRAADMASVAQARTVETAAILPAFVQSISSCADVCKETASRCQGRACGDALLRCAMSCMESARERCGTDRLPEPLCQSLRLQEDVLRKQLRAGLSTIPDVTSPAAPIRR